MSKTIEAIEIPEAVLEAAMRRAGTNEPKEAVIAALREYAKPQSQAELVRLLGTSDGFYTAEELERQREIDS